MFRVAVTFAVATGLLGFVQTVAYAFGDTHGNHTEPERG